MKASFSINIDPEISLVHIRLAGFFLPCDIAEFDRIRNLEYRQLRCGPNQHVTVIDITATHIQSQSAVSLFADSLDDPKTRSRKVAFVVAKSLARMQVKRAASGRDEAGFFTSTSDAEAWLLST
jgi:hypothetical protein